MPTRMPTFTPITLAVVVVWRLEAVLAASSNSNGLKITFRAVSPTVTHPPLRQMPVPATINVGINSKRDTMEVDRSRTRNNRTTMDPATGDIEAEMIQPVLRSVITIADRIMRVAMVDLVVADRPVVAIPSIIRSILLP
uniref:Putative secreted peptide n=1 Tax=Anopheles braziliensis TaxID=58242 RepID=A0A2M3ZR87_9DIPT